MKNMLFALSLMLAVSTAYAQNSIAVIPSDSDSWDLVATSETDDADRTTQSSLGPSKLDGAYQKTNPAGMPLAAATTNEDDFLLKIVPPIIAAIPRYPLYVWMAGSGTVSSLPSGIFCGAACSKSYLKGSTVNLSATPASGWRFSHWGGAWSEDCSGSGSCSVSMTAPKWAKANFVSSGLEKVKLLHGQWRFDYSRDTYQATTYYRFDQSTARVSTDPTIYVINGHSSIFSDFWGNWCDGGMIGMYSTTNNEYSIFCDWGDTTYDSGSVYFFQNVGNTFPLKHYWYTPSTGKVLNYPYFGNAQRISTSYSATDLDSALSKVTANQDIEDAKNAQIEEIQKLLASKNQLKHALAADSIPFDIQNQVEVVSRMLKPNN